MFGIGNINFTGISTPESAVQGANNGLSILGTNAVLGNNIGSSLAVLLNDRLIPLNFHSVFLSSTGFLSDAVALGTGRIGITGDMIAELFMNNLNGVNSNQLDLTVSSSGVIFDFGGFTAGILAWSFATRNIEYNHSFSPRAINMATRAVSAGAVSWGDDDCTLLCDTSGGNITVNFDPTNIKTVGRMGWVKKLGVDLNTITITPTSGLIFGGAGGAASFTFSGAGESIQFQSDGTNLYVL